jgi:aldehyde dehydrogenase (NAD+)|eukprot:COSAG01_NODE_5331_length_4330_cov_4.463484_5_plen_195_part_00
MSGNPKEAAKEVATTIERLFHWAAFADKYGGTVQETTLYGMTVAVHEPLGVIGITAPEECPLLALVSLVAPAIVRGNTVVVVPSKPGALAAADLYQVLDTSDLPGGVINIVTGEPDVLTKSMAEHQDIDALWYYGSQVGSYHVETLASDNMKRTLVNYGQKLDWNTMDDCQSEIFLRESTNVKNIWVPMGGVTL